MSTVRWVGGAPDIAQVFTATVGGTIEVGDLFVHVIGLRTFTVAAESTVAADVAQQIATEWNDLDADEYPEFREITAQANGADVLFEAAEPGKPFTLAVSTTEAGGGAADAQTYSGTVTTANSSRNSAGLAQNYSGGALPVNGDTLVFDVDADDCLYDLEALAAVTLAELRILAKRFRIGLRDTNAGGYPEYRPKFFKVGATDVLIDSESPLVNLDLGTVQTSVVVQRTGVADQQFRRALNVKGSNASNEAFVNRGNVAFSGLAGEASRFPTLRLGYVDNVDGDADVYCGPDCTLATVVKNGGRLETWSAVTTGTNRAGLWIHQGGAVTTLNTLGTGETRYNSEGALGTPKVTQQGVLDFGKDPRDKVVTNPIEVYGDQARVLDPNNVVNVGGTMILDLNEGAGLGNIVIGANRRITVGTVA